MKIRWKLPNFANTIFYQNCGFQLDQRVVQIEINLIWSVPFVPGMQNGKNFRYNLFWTLVVQTKSYEIGEQLDCVSN